MVSPKDMRYQKMTLKNTILACVLVLVLTGVVLYFNLSRLLQNDTSPKGGVSVLKSEIVVNEGLTKVKGILLNDTSEPITYVRLKLSCTSIQGDMTETLIMVGNIKKTVRSLNRMTGQYENREYEIGESIGIGEKYQFEKEVEEMRGVSSCELSVGGWARYNGLAE